MKKILISSVVFIVILDQWTKLYIKNNFDLYELRPVIDGFFSITYVLNPGAAFGMLAKLDDSYRQGFFVIITAVAILAVIYLMSKEKDMKIRLVSYTLILAGAIGNFIDRIYIGKVVDFLHFYYKQYQWPAFNVADIAISVGIGILFLDYIILSNRSKR
ncbi:lipoprotein signal peptidase [Denitrovibrio acetiphilus DSM 12809]|uniref:Lipoprotein signal peptidase n=1 Tax=Denitrovibrio acetiphilus (strain DSM 12809 / NBRC 114555 / N2460) TaxID=522772 RepID=D4H0M2_DENA2|nr:signal peptidase II [Denitrovibrio acetiphilus]ADD68535.1 lipoprotein signal peptidase [Denitrovibrio acetiphilus DSM 12809]